MELEIVTKNAFAEIWLNRPEKLNALTDDMMARLRQAILDFDDDDDVKAIVLRGRGRAFSAGFDISPKENPLSTVSQWRKHLKNGNDAFRAIRYSEKPVIAAVHGPCMGGAFEMSMSCDLVIATPEAFFGETEVRFGGTAMFLLLPYLAPKRLAQRLLLTGDRIDAREALAGGLITTLVEAAELESAIAGYVQKLDALPPGTATMNKRALRRGYDMWGATEATELSEDLAILALMNKEGGSAEFSRIAREEGLTAAIRWRDAQFQTR